MSERIRGNCSTTCASVKRSSPLDALRIKTTLQTLSKSRAISKFDLSRRPPFAKTRTLPNSRVQRVAMRLVSLQSVVRTTMANALSAMFRSEIRFEPPSALRQDAHFAEFPSPKSRDAAGLAPVGRANDDG